MSRQAADEDQAAEVARVGRGDAGRPDRRRQPPSSPTGAAASRAGPRTRPGREAGQRLPAAQAEADRYRRAADDASALVHARVEKSRQEEAYIDAKIEMAELLAEAAQLRMARIDGMRAELAATLVDGAPCPVCGSLDHPELCELRGERVTREQEEAAAAEAAQAAEQAEMIGAKLGAADVRVTDLSARLADAGFTVAADLASLQAEASRLEAAARDRRPKRPSWPPPRPGTATSRARSRPSTRPSPPPRSASPS